jgi:probable HAF family extracellular repeat protein
MRGSVLLVLSFFLPAVALSAGPTFTLFDLGPGPVGVSDNVGFGGWGLTWTVWTCTNGGIPTLISTTTPALNCAGNSFGEVGSSPAAPGPIDSGVPLLFHAFLFGFHTSSSTGKGPTMDLGTLGENADSTATSLNPAGTAVVGYSGLGEPELPLPLHAFLWRASTGMTDLGTFKHGDFSRYSSQAAGVNDALQIVGFSENLLDTGEVAQRAALWEGGQIYELQYQVVGVKVNSFILTQASGISCSGLIAAIGYAASAPAVEHNYLLVPTRTQPCT